MKATRAARSDQRAALPAATPPMPSHRRQLEVAHLADLIGPSHYPIGELVEALGVAGIPRARSRWPNGGESLSARAAERLGLNRNITRRSTCAVLVPLMGPKATCLFPYSLARECVVFCWDVWLPDTDAWARLLHRHRVRFALMTARTSARYWQAATPGLRTAWIPEAIEPPSGAPGNPLEGRSIHVLELGRRHAGYHAAITPTLARTGYVHLYEPTPGKVVFATRRELVSGLLDTLVSVCFPSSLTHPQRSGDVEALTRRYLESMAAGSIVVGSAPAELVDLFGYDPVVPVDWRDPAGQLFDVIRQPARYAPLVARNYARFLQVGTWKARVPQLLSTLHSWGFQW